MFLAALTLTSLMSLSGEASFSELEKKWQTLLQRTIPILRSHEEKNDADLDAFVSRYIPLRDKNYAPNDLESVSGSTSVSEAGRTIFLRKEARNALWNMARDFEKNFSTPLVVISGYRSAAYQQRMWDLGKCTDTLCAPPGYSEHQLGLAIDVFDATTESDYEKNARYRKYIAWLSLHAHEYGWHQSYQKWEYIDAYEVEPWHWRYLGVDLATKLKKLDMSYTEYMRLSWVLDLLKK